MPAVRRISGVRRSRQSPPTTPTSLVYRLISHMLTTYLNDRESWNVRSLLIDSSGMDGGIREELKEQFPKSDVLLRELRESTNIGQGPPPECG